jgi:hypothetical protein
VKFAGRMRGYGLARECGTRSHEPEQITVS